MQSAMDRLERFVTRRRRLVLGVWIVVLLASLPFAAQQTKNLTSGGFEVPGSGSVAVSESLKNFPGVQSEPLILVFDNRNGDPQKLTAAVDDTVRKISGIDNVGAPQEAIQAAKAAGDQPVSLLPLAVSGSPDQAVDAARELRENLGLTTKTADVPVPVHVVGQQALWAGMQDVSKEDLEKAEASGFPIVFIVLLAVFGSLAAAALPLALGAGSVIVTGAIVFWLSKVYGMSIFVTNMASMLGIGVAVDYSLFILARYREELNAGRSHDEAREAAMRTSGMAVVFSGVTVIVALSGLFLIDATVVRSMAVGAIVVVAIAVLAFVLLRRRGRGGREPLELET
jgi:uncharacterized membrane protein YdfJ with MMPL/SSD domain